jgi:hypothetical protein
MYGLCLLHKLFMLQEPMHALFVAGHAATKEAEFFFLGPINEVFLMPYFAKQFSTTGTRFDLWRICPTPMP